MRKIILVILVAFAGTCPVLAYPDKDFYSSDEINDGDYWSNVNIYGNDTVVDMFGGWVGNLTTHNQSIFNVYGGSVDFLLTSSDSSFINIDDSIDIGTITVEEFGTVDIHSGSINALSATGGSINLYAYDITYDPTGGSFGEGELTGRYYKNDNFFAYDLHEGVYPYITVIPEPATFLLVGLGGLLLRKKRK